MPLDMLMGIFGGGMAKGTPGSEEFGRMLGLFDAATGDGSGLPVPGLPMTPKPEVAVAQIPQLLLPQGLAQSLGLIGQPLPESQDQSLPMTDNPQSMIPVQAELLSIDSGNHQALYLKLPHEGMSFDSDAQLIGGDNKEEAMVLPMRLRTVEQQGGRIIADAELQTAAGKDASIRIRLELAGDPARIQEMISQPARANAVPGPLPPTGELSLPRLLNNLDVKSLVVEHVQEAPNVVSKEVFPGMTAMARNISGLKLASNSPIVPNSIITGEMPEPENAGVMPVIPENDGVRMNVTGNNRNKMEWLQFENAVSNNQTISTPSNFGNETTINGITTIPASGIGNGEAVIDGNSDVAQARFYDLDNRIDQLKQNSGQKINIQLMPSRLGKMELSIISHRGMVTVKLAVDSVQAKQAVERSLGQLESQLSSSGIRVDSFQLQVNQSSRNASYAAYQQQYDHSRSGYTGHQNHGFHRQAHHSRQLAQFRMSDTGFEQAMVNCLA